MEIKIALVGNPNCGKTTMFNDLTGSSQYVGNWPGVTVEKKEGRLRGQKGVVITDLPGIYSLSPYTLEEVVSRNYLMNERPAAIINLVDATNLERNLYLTTQVVELGIPVVIALNMMDIVKKSGDKIDTQKLGEALGCAVVETSALKGTGSLDAARKAIELAKTKAVTVPRHTYNKAAEQALSTIAELVNNIVDPHLSRWSAINVFERDERVLEALQLPQELHNQIEAIIQTVEEKEGDDSETIITNERYEYISKLMDKHLRKSDKSYNISDKIDRVVTNRIWALPIFAGIIFAIYFIAVSSVGKIATNFMNDTLFGDWITNGATAGLKAIGAADWLQGLILNGIIGGVGTVLGFVPQMLIVFFFLSFLEDCGYMARIAFIMDRIFRRFGLSGKSFIPILISSGCGVPGIMGTRTIESEKDRRMTIMVTTFMPCSAKLTIISMMVASFFPHSFIMAPAMYFLGIGVIVFSGIVLKKTAAFSGEPAPFVMELPP
ncbi:MAG: ferrous iron transport protein B [Ethanoligenens sp.]